jgi:hypothetical protein
MQTTRSCLSEIEQDTLRDCWRSVFDARWPGAEPLLERISPPNWTLEWSLPGWVGDALGLPPEMIRAVTLGNVFGLAYVRLHDDLSDKHFMSEERSTMLALATRLYQRWLAIYIQLFGDNPDFWTCFERYLDEWLHASLGSNQLPGIPFQSYDETHFLALGHRGALIKVCAAATCLLAERKDLLPPLERCLDTLMIGAVLLDHAADWGEDLEAMRPNTFVASLSPLPQNEVKISAHRAAVLRELTIGQGARSYFAVIDQWLGASQSEAEATGIAGLANDCAWLRQHAASYRRRVTAGARRALGAITSELLSTAADSPV